MFIYKFIYQTKWLDKEHFQISDKSGQVVFVVNVHIYPVSGIMYPVSCITSFLQ